MVNDIHYNRAFYALIPEPGTVFRQVVILEMRMGYEILIFEGEVLRTDKELQSRAGSTHIRTISTIGAARAIADEISRESISSGWVTHHC